MAENYDLIFGQSASQQYAWSDSDYQNGWQTVGSTPPTAEQFDALQRRSDTKAQDLNNRLEPIESKSEADGRQAATSYTAGAMVTVDGLPNGWLLQCIVPGISGTDAITLPDTLIDGLTIIDGDATWALRKVATNGGLGYRQPNTAYTAGQIAYHTSLPTGYYLECTTAGTTSAGDITPSSTIGGTVSDGTAVWTIRAQQQDFKDYRDTEIGDCNTAKSSGMYFIRGNTINTPEANTFGKMLVFKNANFNNNIGQLLYTFGGAGREPCGGYYRFFNDSWGAWQRQEAIVAKSLVPNGYIKYASGLIVQWGYVTSVQSGNNTTVNFPISFTVDNPKVFLQDNNTASTAARGLHTFDCYKTLFKIASSVNLYMVNWFAIGY